MANRALEETRAKLTAKITELKRENQFLKGTRRKMQYDPCNPEIEENKVDEELHRPRVEHPKHKTLVARPMEIPHLMEGVACSENNTPKSNEVKLEDLEDWK